jgi:CRISPR-associated protein Csb2
MTVVLDVAYPFGYVHATPWGTHVNEGAVEWPPSPWRLLRALVATWHTRCPDLPADVLVGLLSTLAEPPAVRTAARTEASVRSYLPDESHRSGSAANTDLVVDAFAAVAPGTGVSYRWDADLDPAAAAALEHLAAALPYLGRAESICEAVARFDDTDVDEGWIEPSDDVSGRGRRALVATAPVDLDAISVQIRTMRKSGWRRPPGTRWVRYGVDEPLRPQPPTRPPRRLEPVVAVRLVLHGTGISVRQTLAVAETVRKAAMSVYGRQHEGGASPQLAGKDADEVPLTDHRHAHWLPIDTNGDRLLDVVVVWVPGGLSDDEVAAIDALRTLRFSEGSGLDGRHLDVGIEATIRAGAADAWGTMVPGLRGPARRWRSVTPFLPTRYRKGEEPQQFLFDLVRRELQHRQLPGPDDIVVTRRESWGSFRRHRRSEPLRQARPGFGFDLTFSDEVTGPLCLGALSHFGMGRFEPMP